MRRWSKQILLEQTGKVILAREIISCALEESIKQVDEKDKQRVRRESRKMEVVDKERDVEYVDRQLWKKVTASKRKRKTKKEIEAKKEKDKKEDTNTGSFLKSWMIRSDSKIGGETPISN